MKMNRATALLGLTLAACSHEAAGVRLTKDVPSASVPAAKVEPVFYNGKTYQVSLSPEVNGNTSVSITGMSAAQTRDAAGLANSSFHHFVCKDSQKAVVTTPAFDGTSWRALAHCG